MRYKDRERVSLLLQLVVSVFVLPLLTSIPIIAIIAYLHAEWWHVIPVMHYSTAYWGQVILAAISTPIVVLGIWVRAVIS
jgi:hypothetical protein